MLDPGLKKLFKSQPEVGELASHRAFISMGFTYTKQELAFNHTQETGLVEWIKRCAGTLYASYFDFRNHIGFTDKSTCMCEIRYDGRIY